MKKLLLTAAVVGLLAGSAFACGDHAKTLGDAYVAGKSMADAMAMVKDLKAGEVIACSQLGADGKYTRIYSSVAGAVPNEVLSGDAEKNTKMMFDALAGKKVGEVVEVNFISSADGKTPMKGSVMFATADVKTVCAVMRPAEAPKEAAKVEAKVEAPKVEVKKEEVKKEEVKPVVPAAPAAK